MSIQDCSLWLMVARTDVAYMMQTIPHLVRICNYPFFERVLAIDTAEISGEKKARPHVGTLEQLRQNCKALVESGVVDRVIDIDYSDAYRRKVYKKHFGNDSIRQTHNYKGYPVLGSIFCIEECRSEYLLHFDSDMLLYQSRDFNWINEGIALIEKHQDIFCVRPSSGPQSEKNNLYRDVYKVAASPDEIYRLKYFSSRCYLLDKYRFDDILPLKVKRVHILRPQSNNLLAGLRMTIGSVLGRAHLDSWEAMVSRAIQRRQYFRADLASQNAWTLHPARHGGDFLKALESVIRKVESGYFPSQQAGSYDLQLQYWSKNDDA